MNRDKTRNDNSSKNSGSSNRRRRSSGSRSGSSSGSSSCTCCTFEMTLVATVLPVYLLAICVGHETSPETEVSTLDLVSCLAKPWLRCNIGALMIRRALRGIV